MAELTAGDAAGRRLEVLDVLRFVAALAVVSYHWLFNGIVNGKVASLSELPSVAGVARYGHLGVNLFFLISGFVIFRSAHGKTARQFAVSRAVRLYPAFWVALLLTSAMTLAWGAASGLSVSAPQVAANMTMAPQVLGVAAVDGVYWTLLLELAFYGLVFCSLAVGRLELFASLLPGWSVVVLLATLFTGAREDSLLIGGYFALFASGAIVAEIGRRGWSAWRVTGLAAGCAAALVSVVRHEQALVADTGRAFSGAVAVGIVLMCFGLLLSLNNARVQRLRVPGAALLGNLTYPVYLIHAHVGYMVLTRWATESNKWWVYGAAAVAVLAVAWAIHVLIERRLRRQWFRIFDGSVGRAAGAISRILGPMVTRRAPTAPEAATPARG